MVTKSKPARRTAAALVTLVAFAAALTMSAPATARDVGTGTWRTLNPTTFKIPANWRCSATKGNVGISIAQMCIVRSGNYVQPALIIRNSTYRNLSAQPYVSISALEAGAIVKSSWVCPPSSLAPRGLSVCFGATQYKPKAQSAIGIWPNNTYTSSDAQIYEPGS